MAIPIQKGITISGKSQPFVLENNKKDGKKESRRLLIRRLSGKKDRIKRFRIISS